MPRKAKSTKPAACEVCAGTELVPRITTYAVRLTGPLEGKQIHVGRVALHECETCGHLMPTPAGQAKVARNVDMGIRLFLGQPELTRIPATTGQGPAIASIRRQLPPGIVYCLADYPPFPERAAFQPTRYT